MQFDIKYSDPSFYSEIDLVERRFENSLIAYRLILERFQEASEATNLSNMKIPEMLLYQSVLFDKVKLAAHSLSYFEEAGQLAQKLKISYQGLALDLIYSMIKNSMSVLKICMNF